MAARTYQTSARQPYGETAGSRLLAAIEALGADPFTVEQAVAEGTTLGLSRRYTLTLLHRVADGGWLTRVKKGLYAQNDPVSKLPKAHPFAIATAIVTPSAVSHWSALQHWGLTEQVPLTVTVSSPSRTFPPTAAPGEGGSGTGWVVAGVHYECVAISPSRLFGVTWVWVSERNRVPVFDRERALLDAFHHFRVFGSPSAGLQMLEQHLTEIDVDALVGYALRLGVAAVAKRIGWALDRLGVPRQTTEPLRVYPSRGESPLDPGLPARGHHDRTWGVIENLSSAHGAPARALG